MEDISSLRELGYREVPVKGRGKGSDNWTYYYIHNDGVSFPYVYYRGIQAPTVELIKANFFKDFFYKDFENLTIIANGKRYEFDNKDRYLKAKKILAREVLDKHKDEMGVLKYEGIFDRAVVIGLKLLDRGALILKQRSYIENPSFVPAIGCNKDDFPTYYEVTEDGDKVESTVIPIHRLVEYYLPIRGDRRLEQRNHTSGDLLICLAEKIVCCNNHQNNWHKPSIKIEENDFLGEYTFKTTDTSDDIVAVGRKISILKDKDFRIEPDKECKQYRFDKRELRSSLGYSSDYISKINDIKQQIKQIENNFISEVALINGVKSDKQIESDRITEQVKVLMKQGIQDEELREKMLMAAFELYDEINEREERIADKKRINDSEINKLKSLYEKLKVEAEVDLDNRFRGIIQDFIQEVTLDHPSYVLESIEKGVLYFRDYSKFTVTFESRSRVVALTAQGFYEKLMYGEFAYNIMESFDKEFDIAFRYYMLTGGHDTLGMKKQKLERYKNNADIIARYYLQSEFLKHEVDSPYIKTK